MTAVVLIPNPLGHREAWAASRSSRCAWRSRRLGRSTDRPNARRRRARRSLCVQRAPCAAEAEKLTVLSLDRRNGVLARDIVSSGCPSGTVADAPSILRTALRNGAASVALAHNHVRRPVALARRRARDPDGRRGAVAVDGGRGASAEAVGGVRLADLCIGPVFFVRRPLHPVRDRTPRRADQGSGMDLASRKPRMESACAGSGSVARIETLAADASPYQLPPR